MVQVKGQYQLADYQAAQRLHAQGNRLARAAGYVILGVISLLALVSLFLALTGKTPWTGVIIPVLLPVFWVLIQYVLLPRQVARVFAQQKDLSAPFEIGLDDEGFRLENQFGSSRVPWQDFAKWKQNGELLLLYRSDVAFHMLPKRFLPNPADAEFVVDRLRAHNVPHASQVRNPVQMAALALILLAVIIGVIVGLNSR